MFKIPRIGNLRPVSRLLSRPMLFEFSPFTTKLFSAQFSMAADGEYPSLVPNSWRVTDSGKEKVNGHLQYSQGVEVWKEAPILMGSTNFEPRPEVKNIMVTGGAGFM